MKLCSLDGVRMEVEIPKVFEKKMEVPEKLLLGPGPSNYPERVRKAMANPVLGQLHPETFKIMDDIKEGLKSFYLMGRLCGNCKI